MQEGGHKELLIMSLPKQLRSQQRKQRWNNAYLSKLGKNKKEPMGKKCKLLVIIKNFD